MKKRNVLLKILADACIVACGMIAASCAMPTAFSVPFSLKTMLLGCCIGALLLSAWMHLPRGGIAPGLAYLFGAVAFGVVRRKVIWFGARWILYTLTQPLSSDFKFIPSFSAPALPDGADAAFIPTAVSSALLLLIAAVGMLMAFSLIRGKIPLLTVLIPLPLFLLSLIYTDQPPAIWTIVLLLLYTGGALLGYGLRKGDSDRLWFFLTAIVPLMLILMLLIRVVSPQGSFTPIPFEQRKTMLGERIEAAGDVLLSAIRRNPKKYDLNREEERKESEKKAFSAQASQSGVYLLRSHSYGQYRNGVWLEAEEYTGEWRSMEALGRHASGARATLTIKDAVTNERYVPYAFQSDSALKVDESSVRASGKTGYGWTFATSIDLSPSAVSSEEKAYLSYAMRAYTMPDGEPKQRLLEIANAAGLSAQGDAVETAFTVAAFVKQSGSYTLTPGETPADRDFVEYFLTEGHRGYCVHFASATTALLQAMGVPARYTIGYRAVATMPDSWFDVTEQTAHAWVEVYLAGVGWIPIESTAGFSYDVLNTGSAQSHVTPRPTAVPQTTATPEPRQTPDRTASAATPTATNAAAPSAGTGAGETAKPVIIGDANVVTVHESHVSPWWLLLLSVPLLPVLWIGIGALIRRRRTMRFRQKDAKKAVLSMLRYLERLERFGVRRDPNAQEWAEEATFSNHDMTETKRLLLSKVRKTQDTLYRESPVRRFFVKWILVAI